MHELLLDQLPYLAELQRFLENLSVMEPPQAKQDLIIEQVFFYSVTCNPMWCTPNLRLYMISIYFIE